MLQRNKFPARTRALTAAHQPALSRRTFVTGLAATGLLGGINWQTGRAQTPGASATGPAIISGNRFDLGVGYREVNFTGTPRLATVVNGGLPAPTLRWKEGTDIALRVTNNLAVDTSIHWHGILLPPGMDGVPGISFNGIQPGETFEYRYRLQQAGTYWYHSHSGFQEQAGVYAPLIVDPARAEPVAYDRELVILLSDWEDPARVYARLKRDSEYYNRQQRTVGDAACSRRGFGNG